jgi:hypothetical protein
MNMKEFWKWVESQGRGARDVREVCEGQDAQGWVFTHVPESWAGLQRLCEERFAEIPKMLPKRPPPTMTVVQGCPRCSGALVEETDHYGLTCHCLMCGWRD